MNVNKKNYRVLCTYQTEDTSVFPVRANTKEEAKEIAKDQFNRWNDYWITKEHGNPKYLMKVEIVDC